MLFDERIIKLLLLFLVSSWTLEFLEKSHGSVEMRLVQGLILFEIHHRFDREGDFIRNLGIIPFPPGTFLSRRRGKLHVLLSAAKTISVTLAFKAWASGIDGNREDVGFHRVSERRSVREYKSGHPVHGGAPTHVARVHTHMRVCVYARVSARFCPRIRDKGRKSGRRIDGHLRSIRDSTVGTISWLVDTRC